MDNDKPRQAYYAFAHQALPEVFFSDPPLLIKTLRENGVTFLQYIWKKMEQYAEVAGEGVSEQLSLELTKFDDADLALVTLPTPQKRTEAYYIAMLAGSSSQQPRYLTLEYGLEMDEQPYTVLGEWTAENIHHNHGAGPQPDAAGFIQAVRTLLIANP